MERTHGADRPAWLLPTLAFAAALVVHAVLFPPFRAPDEHAHVDRSRQVAERLAGAGPLLHPPDEVQLVDEQVERAAARTGLTGPAGDMPPLPAGAARPRDQRPAFAALGPSAPGDVRNQMTQHPPGYYLLAGAVSSWLESPRPHGAPFDLHVLALRLLSALLFLPLPALAARSARRLGADPAVAGLAALLPLGVPMLTHIGAAVNNDALLVLAGASMTPLLVAAASGRRSWPATVTVAVLGGVALLTKGFGLVLPVWAALAYAAGAQRGTARAAFLHGATAVGGSLLLGGWWWLRNVVVLGTVQPHHAPLQQPPADFAPDWGWWLPFAVRRFTRRFWIEPDTLQEAAPWEFAASAVLLALVIGGVVVAARRGRARPALVALAPAVMATGLVAIGAVDLYRATSLAAGIQGRYTYFAMAGVFAVAALAVARAGARRPLLVAGLAAAIAVMQARAWLAALGFYWGEPGAGLGASVRAVLAWSPIPPALAVAAAVVFWVLLAAASVRLVLAARRIPAIAGQASP